MLEFLSRWLSRVPNPQDGGTLLPPPVTQKNAHGKWKQHDLKPLDINISSPIPQSSPQSLTGFDDFRGEWLHPLPLPQAPQDAYTPTRGPPNVAWLQGGGPLQGTPAVIRLPSRTHLRAHVAIPIGRSVSSPSPLTTSSSSRWNLRLNTSTHSLGLDSKSIGGGMKSTDVAYNYPLAKQLSPIAEQDYFSPESLRQSIALPASSNSSPSGSQTSEITRPSPTSHPFISRQLNRTISQTSSRTQVSTTSSSALRNGKSAEAPSIPPLNLTPPFPGPHPSQNMNSNPPLRPLKSTVATMETIMSEEGYDEYDGEGSSLHAESFVTATSEAGPTNSQVILAFPRPPEMREEGSSGEARRPSVSESFISRRWNRDHGLGTGFTFRAKREWNSYTPGFWAFWLGFMCPVLWLIGGWHFTRIGEQPARKKFWEFYFHVPQGGEGKGEEHRLPRWVTEKQSSDDGRARLQDPKRSLKGISFGYPFIPRPPSSNTENKSNWATNKLLDLLYGVKLKEVRGRPESGRRMFDPWIQRCRYVFCYWLLLVCIGLCSTSTYLIIYNTRQL